MDSVADDPEHGQLLNILRSAKEEMEKQPKRREIDVSPTWFDRFSDAIDGLEPDFLKGKWFRLPNGEGRPSDRTFTGYCFRMLFSGVSPEKVIEIAEQQVNEDKATYFQVTEIRGVETSEITNISENIFLYPNQMLPNSATRDRVFSDPAFYPHMFPNRNCAIVQKFDWEKIVFSSSDESALYEPSTGSEWDGGYERCQEITRVIGLMSQHHVQIGTRYIANETPSLFESRSSQGPSLNRTDRYSISIFNSDEFLTLYKKTVEFKSQPSITMAIDRLNSSRQWKNYEDIMIYLGLALEIIVFHKEKNENQEISYKLGTRLAYFLGDNGEERLKIFNLAKDIYKARSEAVHNGKLKKEKYSTVEFIDEARVFVKTLIYRILDFGDFPDWDQIVLNKTS